MHQKIFSSQKKFFAVASFVVFTVNLSIAPVVTPSLSSDLAVSSS